MERLLAVVAIILGIVVLGGGAVLAVTLAGGGFDFGAADEAQSWANTTVEVRCYTSDCKDYVGPDEQVRLQIEHADWVNGSYQYRPVIDTTVRTNTKFKIRLRPNEQYRIRVSDHGDTRTLGVITINPDPNRPLVLAPFPCCGDGPIPTPAPRYRVTETPASA